MSHNSKFFPLLRSLKPEELIGFQRYLKRFHGGEATPLKVFDYCKRYHNPKIVVDAIDLGDIYRKLYKAEMANTDTERKKILNPLSDLGIWLKEFLLAEKMRSESWVSQMVWLGILQERGLHNEGAKLASELYKKQDKKLPDAIACLQQIATGMYYKRYLVQQKASPDFTALAACAASIKQSADIISLKMDCEIKTNQKIRSKKYAEPTALPTQPLMSMYQMISSLLSSEKEADYFNLVAFLDKHVADLGDNEVFMITRLLHNFIAPKIRSAKGVAWGKQVHALDKISLKKGLFTQNGVMSPTNFCNIVNLACSAQEIAWAQKFVLKNARLLPEEAQLDCINLANAIIAFEEKEFNKVLDLLEEPQLKHIQHAIRVKALRLRTLYELDPQHDVIEDLLVSFEIYLKRNRHEQPDFVDATLSFLKLFKKLYHVKVSKQMLIQEIEAVPQIYFYHWLLEKAKGYKQRNARQKRKNK